MPTDGARTMITSDQAKAFGFMTKHLGPKPRSRLDLASQKHDL